MFCRKKDKIKKLVSLISCNNLTKIRCLILENPELLSTNILNDKTILQYICCYDEKKMANIESSTIDLLMKLGADPGKSNSNENNWKPIHYATFNHNLIVIQILLKWMNINQLKSIVYCPVYLAHHCKWLKTKIFGSFSNNALHILLKYGDPTKQQFQQILQLLIDNGVDLDQMDSNGVTPRDLIEQLDDNFIKLPKQPRLLLAATTTNVDNFKYLLENGDGDCGNLQINPANVDEFDGPDEFNSSCTLLQLCCFKGMKNTVQYLLNNGANPNKTIAGNTKLPLILAIRNDHEDIVKLLLTKQEIVLPNDILVTVQAKNKTKRNLSKTNKYMTIMLDYIKNNLTGTKQREFLNAVDSMGRTPLHLATYYGYNDNIHILLGMGASLIRKDIFGATPLDFFETITFNDHLDDCIDIPENDDEFDDMLSTLIYQKRYFELEIKFDNFIDVNCCPSQYPESEFLTYLIKIKKLRPLLNHTVISSYLTVKWQKFRWFSYINLVLYLIAYLSLIFYGFGFYRLQAVSNSFLVFSACLLTFKEFVQIRIIKLIYLNNLVDIFLIIGLLFIIITGWYDNLSNHNTLVALSIIFLLATVELFLQLSNISMFTIQVIILTRITINFCKYMLFYLFPVLAFTICFLMLIETERDIGVFFNTVYKTIAMFAGDPDSDYPDQFKSNPIFGHFIYVIFAIFICIILQNLLVGLAVSDLQEIRRQAAYIEKKERAIYITKLERVLFNWHRSCDCTVNRIGRRILNMCSLFKTKPILIIQPYNYGCVYTEDNRQQKSYIKDHQLINNLQQIFKNISVKSDSELLEDIYDKVECLGQILKKDSNDSRKSSNVSHNTNRSEFSFEH